MDQSGVGNLADPHNALREEDATGVAHNNSMIQQLLVAIILSV